MRHVLSKYTSIIKSQNGDIILHNSFMGAIAHISNEQSYTFNEFIKRGINDPDLEDPLLKELCQSAFFVPLELDESKRALRITNFERDLNEYHIIILPHENCNFRCVYCYETFERQKMKQPVIEGLKKLVYQKSNEYKNLSVSWFGGEPLLAKDVIFDLSESFITSCQESKCNYSSGITTNGYFLTPDTLSKLLNLGVKHFQVTVDGPERLHDANRHLIGGGGTYKQIMKNLTGMRDSSYDFSVYVRVNFNDELLVSIDEFLKEMSVLFSGDKRFRMSFHTIGKLGGPNDFQLETCEESSRMLKYVLVNEKLRKLGLSSDIDEKIEPNGVVCYAGKNSSIVVRTDGKVCKCTVALEDPRNIVGSLTPEGHLRIDKRLWNLWTTLDEFDDSKCSSCSFSPACQSRSCPLTAMNDKEPPCPYSKDEFEHAVKFVTLKRLKELKRN
jgi:uncharacterized protein